jgi:HlyD family secretion protein
MSIRLSLALIVASIAPASAQDQPASVVNVVEGRTSIIFIKPQGSLVKKGEVVCELDPEPLKERLANRKIVMQAAAAASEGAKLARQAAELAVTEYVEGTFKRDWETASGEIALTDSDRKLAEDRLEAAQRMTDKGRSSQTNLVEAKRALDRAVFAFEQAQTKKQVLQAYTKDVTIMKLKSEVERARADELAKRAAYERDQAALKRLEKQIENCKIVAPASGRIHYARPIAEGVVVRGGQLLLEVIPEAEPKAEAK